MQENSPKKEPLLLVSVEFQPEEHRIQFSVDTSNILEKMYTDNERYKAFKDCLLSGLEMFESQQEEKAKQEFIQELEEE